RFSRDWSSDVCSSDLLGDRVAAGGLGIREPLVRLTDDVVDGGGLLHRLAGGLGVTHGRTPHKGRGHTAHGMLPAGREYRRARTEIGRASSRERVERAA